MKTLLITAIAGDIAQSIAKILREAFPHCRLLGIDLHERHGGQLVVDKCYLAPPASAPAYGDWIRALVQQESVDICIPMSEAELLYFANTGVANVGRARLLMPNQQAIDVGLDKLATAQFLQSNAFPAPWTVSADEPETAHQYPCIFKPRRSAGSKGVFVCNSKEDVLFFRQRYSNAILQELLLPADREVTCALYRAKRSGKIAVLQLLRNLAGGFTAWAQVIDDQEVRRQCIGIAQVLDLDGAINIQLRITPAGPRIFEINPRFSSTVLMRHLLGFADVLWALSEVIGQSYDVFSPPVGSIVVRTQGAAILNGGHLEKKSDS